MPPEEKPSMSDPPASYYDGSESLIRIHVPSSSSKSNASPASPHPPPQQEQQQKQQQQAQRSNLPREPTPPKRRHDDREDDHPPPRHVKPVGAAAPLPNQETGNTAADNKGPKASSPKPVVPKVSTSVPTATDKPLEQPKVLKGTAGPTFKQQASGGSILKVEGVTVAPSEATLQATEEARRQQAADRQNSTASLAQHRGGTGAGAASTDLSSSFTHSQNHQHESRLIASGSEQFRRPKLGESIATGSASQSQRSSSGQQRALPPKATGSSQNQFKSSSDIWEFDTPTSKSSCCTIS